MRHSRAISTLVVITALCSLTNAGSVHAENKSTIFNQQNELKSIKKEVEQSRKRLDSLKNNQLKLQRRIGDYDQKLSSDRKIIGRLTGELKQLKKGISRAEEQLITDQQSFERLQRRFLGSIRQFYYVTKEPDDRYLDLPNRESESRKQVIYLTSLSSFEAGNVNRPANLLAESVLEIDDLTGQKSLVSRLKKKTEVSYSLDKSQKRKQQKSLDRLRRKSMEETDRIMTLEQAAAEMERIIARLEQEAAEEKIRRTSPGTSVFASLKGQLISPFRGRITELFGPSTDKVTKLKSFSPGIPITGKPGGSVLLVHSGTVAYTGNLRGYGNFVIINHDNLYYTTYAELGTILVTQGQHLQTGTRLGTSGDEGIVKFELRQGREPLDPVTWIKIETL
jgi:septal ring factor EnvC (AmiA/AmiB activator)